MEGFLTKKQKQELLLELRLEKNRKYADRIRIILLLDKGEPASKIAEYFYLTENSVRNYKSRYTEDGLEGLLIDYHIGRSSYLSPEEQKSLVFELCRIPESCILLCSLIHFTPLFINLSSFSNIGHNRVDLSPDYIGGQIGCYF